MSTGLVAGATVDRMTANALDGATGRVADDGIAIVTADYANPAHAAAIVDLLDTYACDPAGGGAPLSAFARGNLIAELARRPQAFSVLAFDESSDKSIGLINCIEGFSTFACKPLVNVHDVVVLAGYRSRHIAERMLAHVESIARARGCCKLTLEVLQGNAAAQTLYARCGFAGYALDPAFGDAVFLQKPLAGA